VHVPRIGRSMTDLETAADPIPETTSTIAATRRLKPVPHPSRQERAATGKAVRKKLSLTQLADLSTDDRPRALTLLQSQDASRVPDLVPIRYGRMSASNFTFFRGGALVMASDLAANANSGLTVQLCGDAHINNFGIYASPERRLVFDINDFDETHAGPFEWDVKRMAASVAIAAQLNGFTKKQTRDAASASALGYREAMRTLAANGNLAIWYSHLDAEEILTTVRQTLDARRMTTTSSVLEKARTKDSIQAVSKLAELVDGQLRFVSQPPLVRPIEDFQDSNVVEATYSYIRTMIRGYRSTLQRDRRHLLEQFRLVHMARKVVGVGSVGTRSWLLLFEGVDGGDPLVLQAKEAQDSVLERFAGKSRFKHQGQRVVHGQQFMQATSDIFLGWQSSRGLDDVEHDFYIRQLRDGKGSIDPVGMLPDGLALYGRICGETLARAHARSGDRIAIASYLGARTKFEDAITEYALKYADVNAGDYATLTAAIASGEISAIKDL
jgi:uncharacterized protein (DUF2252 family)